MSKIIKLRGVKEKKPFFSLYNSETKQEVSIGNFLNLKINGISFKEEEYEGVLNFKLKMNADIITDKGVKPNIFIDLGGSSVSKSILNSLISSDSLDNIQISVYKYVNKTTGAESVSSSVLNLSLPDNGVKGVQNSRVLKWHISPEEKATMVETIKNSKGEVKSVDYSKFDESLRDMLEAKFGDSHPMSFVRQVSGDIFDAFDSPQTTQNPNGQISDVVFDDGEIVF